MDRLIEVVGLALGAWFASRWARATAELLRLYRGGALATVVDAVPGQVRPPEAVAAALEQLDALGFHPIGERIVTRPASSIAPPEHEWLVVDDTGEMYISVSGPRVAAVMRAITHFERGGLYDSSMPYPRRSAAELVAAQRAEVARARAAGIQPERPVRTVADTIALEAHQRRASRNSMSLGFTVLALLPGVIATGVAVMCGWLLLH
jgi:hypothetical protein